MVPASKNHYSPHHDVDHHGPSEAQVWLAIAGVVIAVAALLALYALASGQLGLVPVFEPVAYCVVAISAIALLANFLITFIPNEFHAGAWLIVAWAVTIFTLAFVFSFFA